MDLHVEVWHGPKITDHSMVVLNWNIKEAREGRQRILCPVNKRMDVDKFKRLVELNINVNEEESINKIASRMVESIVECIDIVAPKKPIVIKNKWQGKQWFSEDTYQLMNQRNLAHKVARLNNSSKDWNLFKQPHLRTKVVDTCRKAKERDYLEKKLDKNKGEPKQMWRLLKEMLKIPRIIGNIKSYNAEINNNVKEMADEFNKYFLDSITEIATGNGEDDLPIGNEHPICVFEQFDTIHERDLRNMVGKLINKAGTEEGVTVEIMKLVMEVAGETVCYIVNRLLQDSIVPEKWKEAIVIPISKVWETIRVDEFRSINKLPVYEKILEMVVQKQLMEYLESNELITVCQSGFRSGHSCETALQWVLTDWKNAIGKRQMIGVVFLDLKRVFEVVDRRVLIKKLQRYGLRAAVLEWFRCYLENREQRVKFNGILSN